MKTARARDRPCSFPDCEELVRRSSQFCRHHLGVVHGAASARTFGCSQTCQEQHVRCARCHCLCNGSHPKRLRDELCYQAGAPCCWSQQHQEEQHLVLWTVSCLLCSRSRDFLGERPRQLQCDQCGSRLVEVERLNVTAGLRIIWAQAGQRYNPEAGTGRASSP